MADDYPADAVTTSPHEPFHQLLVEYGLADAARGRSDATLVDRSHPLHPRRPVSLHLLLAVRTYLR